jgi:cobalt-zinc-cadmium efflux system protein
MHSHGSSRNVASKLKIGALLAVCILIAELVGGYLSNSLALISDAGHVFADFGALAFSWYGVTQAQRPSSSGMTFGYHRIGVVVAIVNAVTIFIIAGVIWYEAYRRIQDPPEVNSPIMLSVAVVGLVANLFVVWWLQSDQRRNINVRSAYWHSLGDAIASIGVILGAVIILATGWYLADPIISIAIGVIIVFAAWRILKDGLRVLLEATPQHVNTDEMITTINKLPGVKDVHDVHVWSITPELHAMSSHIMIDDIPSIEMTSIRNRVTDVLRQQFGIHHVTLQLETEHCDENNTYCSLRPSPTAEDDSDQLSDH